jgi:nucleoside-diphosphate-sugar epimerase
MDVVVTGGAGFIGRAVVRRLTERGDRVLAIVRDAARADHLTELGAELRSGDLSGPTAIAEAFRGRDAAIHLAGDYRVGIPAADRPAMRDANVGATLRVLDAAATVGIDRLVAISTVNVFGNTHARIVDERFRRDLADGFLSYYDETKFLAHRAVEERIASGAPIVIAMPGLAYGAHDHSAAGAQLRDAYGGTLRYIAVGDTGVSAVHVDDVAAGIVAALDRGRIGESYILGGQNLRLVDAIEVAARVGGHTPPRVRVPASIARLTSYVPGPIARAAGLPEDLAEVIRASLGVTYWASSAKASTELGYVPRDLASGVRDSFGDA